jgi:nucleotide-binding universal stress UspA family protein
MKILLPLDGTPLSESTLPFAQALAQRWQSELLLVRCCDPGIAVAPELPERIKTQMRQRSVAAAGEYLAHWASALAGLPVACHHPEGRAREEIPRLAEREQCDLIVMAFHAHRVPERWLLGSVAEGVLRRSPCPVLLLHPPAQQAGQFDNVLIPLDGSSPSLRAVQHISPYLAPGARVTLLQCSGLNAQEFGLDEEVEVLQHYLDQMAAQLRLVQGDGWEPEVVVSHGEPAPTILAWANEHGCDLIAMSTQGCSGEGGRWLGSVTEKVARSSPCPVLAFPAPRG